VTSLVGHDPLLVILVRLVDRIPPPPPPARRGRGAPRFYPDRLMLKALVIMIVRHLHTIHELLAVLAEPTAEMQTLRGLLSHDGRFPCRRTWERRVACAVRKPHPAGRRPTPPPARTRAAARPAGRAAGSAPARCR
jgi:hypothetical protein